MHLIRKAIERLAINIKTSSKNFIAISVKLLMVFILPTRAVHIKVMVMVLGYFLFCEIQHHHIHEKF